MFLGCGIDISTKYPEQKTYKNTTNKNTFLITICLLYEQKCTNYPRTWWSCFTWAVSLWDLSGWLMLLQYRTSHHTSEPEGWNTQAANARTCTIKLTIATEEWRFGGQIRDIYAINVKNNFKNYSLNDYFCVCFRQFPAFICSGTSRTPGTWSGEALPVTPFSLWSMTSRNRPKWSWNWRRSWKFVRLFAILLSDVRFYSEDLWLC